MTVVEQLAHEYEEKYTKLKQELDKPMTELAEYEDVLARLERQKKAISAPRKSRKRIENDDILTVLGTAQDSLRAGEIQRRAKVRVNPNTMSQKLKALLRDGQIAREGRGAGSRYRLA